MFYVYEWIRPDTNVTFYVGKGKGRRAWNFKRNTHTNNVISHLNKLNLKPIVVVSAKFISEEGAFEFEKERIKFLENLGNLTNKTSGGEGFCGGKHTVETKEKIGNRFRGKKLSLAHKLKLSVKKSEQTRRNMVIGSAPKKGKPIFNFETLQNNSLTLWQNPSYREKQVALRKIQYTNEIREKIRQKNLGRKASPETKNKMSKIRSQPEFKEQLKNEMGKRWQNNSFREKMMLRDWFSANVRTRFYWGA